MKIKIDENLPAGLADDLRAAGHQAHTVADQGMIGGADTALMAHVRSEGQVLFTLDKGIAGVRLYPPAQYAGIVLFRPRSTGRAYTLAFVRQHLGSLFQTSLSSHLLVVSENGIGIP